jgi:hypothetical protein
MFYQARNRAWNKRSALLVSLKEARAFEYLPGRTMISNKSIPSTIKAQIKEVV